MEKFNLEKHWNGFLNNEVVVNCITEELAKDFLTYCDAQNIVWNGDKPLLENCRWSGHKENTYYNCWQSKWITYGHIRQVTDGRKIVEYQGINYKEVEPKTTNPKKLKPETTKENIEVIYHGRETIVLIKENGKYFKGVSKSLPEDTYNKEFGFILAYQRARANQLGITTK